MRLLPRSKQPLPAHDHCPSTLLLHHETRVSLNGPGDLRKVEFANVVVLNKCDLMDRGDGAGDGTGQRHGLAATCTDC